MQGVLFVLLFSLSAAVASAVTVVAWRRRRSATAAGTVAVVSASTAIWSGTAVFGHLLAAPEMIALTGAAAMIAVSVMTAAYLCQSLAVADRGWRLSRRTALWLAVEPVLFTVVLLTDSRHRLVIASAGLGDGGNIVVHFGPLFWVHTAYGLALVAAATARLTRAWLHGPRAQRRLHGFVLLGNVPSLLGGGITLLGVTGTVESALFQVVAPLGFCLSAALTYWALVRLSLHELVPVTRTHLFDMISDVVVTADGSGRVLDVNPAAALLARRLTPDLPGRLVGLPITAVLGGTPIADRLEDGMEVSLTLTDARERTVDLDMRVSALNDSRGEPVGWAVVARDVTALNDQRRELQETNDRLHEQVATIEALRANLAEQAVRDTLTGLHNRRFLMESLQRQLRLAIPEGSPLSVALLDIDHFKQINDRYGHGAGDQVLSRFAKLVSGRIRQGDVVARYGGEEFVIVLPGATGEQALERVDALRAWVAAGRMPAAGRTLTVTFSAGVASLTGKQSPEELLHAADEALYEAKRAGRNQVKLAEAAPDPSAAAA
ncbi:diguanylate cyclase [Planomonospora sp. ID82291]|uniref:histidine kinase N-terminal 7TM domain-containing diguanylate cyclase n=1 Tax=Planomonospora sp. ID82291 TaxID=2738136 RepID=UPI0018C3F6B3|nr:diguanylate cyclase [Planomonospora sp. ID82291]MBG0818635.1 diguanylate cyclase [Planomonospora sp. ID82291]